MRYVIANWKQNKNFEEVEIWCRQFSESIKHVDLTSVRPVICPPVSYLKRIAEILPDLALGVQDISPFDDGAHTGFVGANQVRQFCRYSIVGHSERGEPRELVMQKVRMCVGSGITPIVCFKSPAEYVKTDGVIYALEDPDNISVGGQYRPKPLSEINDLVKSASKVFGEEAEIIYGGSVNVENAADLASLKDLSGVLVGNASLNPVDFAGIVKIFSI